MNHLILAHAVRTAEAQLGEVSFGIIYVAVCSVNGKCYVGLTGDPLDERISEHLRAARHGEDTKFCRALLKHGEDAFAWFVLEDGIPLEELGVREVYWIAVLGSFWHGYNSTTGGRYQFRVSDETRAKMAAASRGRRHSPETRARLSALARGRKASDETRAKMSEANRRRVDNGTHNWLNETPDEKQARYDKIASAHRALADKGLHPFQNLTEAQKEAQKRGVSLFQRRRVKNGTHQWLGESNPVHRQLADGTHLSQNDEYRERTRQRNRRLMDAGTHPFQNLSAESRAKHRQSQRRRVENGTHPFLSAEHREQASQMCSKRNREQNPSWDFATVQKMRQTHHQKRQNDLAEERIALIESGQQVFC